MIGGEQHWRVSCVDVLEPSLLTEQEEGAEILRAMHTQRLVELHHWARPSACRRSGCASTYSKAVTRRLR